MLIKGDGEIEHNKAWHASCYYTMQPDQNPM